MKIEVSEVKECKGIDWSKPQLVVNEYGDIFYSTGFHCGLHFSGFSMSKGEIHETLGKDYFKPFKGTITLQND